MKSRYPAYEIVQVSNSINRKLDEVTTKSGYRELTGQNSSIIRLLYNNNSKEIFQKDIEKKFNVRRSTISNSLNLLEKKGYVTRNKVENDARLKVIKLTPKGKKAGKDMNREITRFHDSLTAGMTTDDLKLFLSWLDNIHSNLDKFSFKAQN